MANVTENIRYICIFTSVTRLSGQGSLSYNCNALIICFRCIKMCTSVVGCLRRPCTHNCLCYLHGVTSLVMASTHPRPLPSTFSNTATISSRSFETLLSVAQYHYCPPQDLFSMPSRQGGCIQPSGKKAW